jgi:hypothetical protein
MRKWPISFAGVLGRCLVVFFLCGLGCFMVLFTLYLLLRSVKKWYYKLDVYVGGIFMMPLVSAAVLSVCCSVSNHSSVDSSQMITEFQTH